MSVFSSHCLGVLGGSFNPAHEGHVHISLEALKRLDCTKVVWLVSPQNPLKSPKGMASFKTRMQQADALTTKYHNIVVSGMEERLGTRYTVDTLRALKRRFPRTKFVWIMGADNLANIHKWEQWAEIFKLCPVLVLDRAPFSHRALRSKAAIRFGRFRVFERNIRLMMGSETPCFGFGHIRLHPESSTRIRSGL